ncbi:hypothetical protein [Nostoc sp. FACHB-280]|uniref:hypothetical protein n=1 Tax=Nostoc sp. FACHB-280 TaxID=2692839 RepID=UPI00168BE689|nr:hypothetical protein [Nostoc sp. FACHB-280]MBD2495570.1 hypothetical protein [Nostoc sp. FACHB-280]
MKLKLSSSVLVAIISACATLGVALINKTSSQTNNFNNPTPANSSTANILQCHQTIADQVCVSHLVLQINSNEPQQIKYGERLPLSAGDKLKLLNLSYCIPLAVKINRLEAKAVLFQNGIESYQNVLSTPSSFPINTGCHNISNFQQSWKISQGQHRVMIPLIKTDGSYRVVDKSFYLNLDAGN